MQSANVRCPLLVTQFILPHLFIKLIIFINILNIKIIYKYLLNLVKQWTVQRAQHITTFREEVVCKSSARYLQMTLPNVRSWNALKLAGLICPTLPVRQIIVVAFFTTAELWRWELLSGREWLRRLLKCLKKMRNF